MVSRYHRIRQSFGRQSVLRNTLVLAGGTTAAQLIGLATTPVLTRLYDPVAFGAFGTFSAIVTIGASFAGLALPLAIVYADTDDERRALARICIAVSALTGLLCLAVVVVFGHPLASMLNLEDMVTVLYLVPPTLFFAGLVALGRHWRIQQRQFATTAHASVTNAVALNAGQLLAGLAQPLATSLTASYTVAMAAQAWVLRLPRHSLRHNSPSAPHWRTVLRKYRDYPLFRAPQSLLNSTNQFLPIFALSALSGPGAAGLYTLARLVVMAPSQLIGRSVLEAFSPEVSSAVQTGQNPRAAVQRVTLALSLIGIVPFGTLIAFGPWLFDLIFGVSWVEAGHYSRWLSLWMYFAFVNRGCVAVIPALQVQRWFLGYEAVSLAAKVLVIPVAMVVSLDATEIVLILSLLGAVLNIWLVTHVFRNMKRL